MDQALLHQLTIKTVPHKHVQRPILHLGLPSQVDLGYVKLTVKAN